jgi:hypothetical protein
MARGVAMDFHEATITPLAGEDGHTHYHLEIKSVNRSLRELHETLESAMDSFHPPLSARVRSHIVEGAHGEGKPVVFCVEDSFEIQ